jgi:iron complex transport system ATP-binding protein
MELHCQITSLAYRKKSCLREISFSASTGEFIAVIGKNGQGKSTLIRALSGQMPYCGSVTLDGEELSAMSSRKRATRISLMPQQLTTPHITVRELISFGRSPYRSLMEKNGEDEVVILSAMHDADLDNLTDCYLDRISGGELRRAYFGMVLAQDTPLLLLDEATAFLDAEYEARLFGLVRQYAAARKKTVIAVMHSLEYALSYADRILFLHEGTVCFFGTPEELLATDLPEEIFGLHRFAAHNGEGRERFFFSAL